MKYKTIRILLFTGIMVTISCTIIAALNWPKVSELIKVISDNSIQLDKGHLIQKLNIEGLVIGIFLTITMLTLSRKGYLNESPIPGIPFVLYWGILTWIIATLTILLLCLSICTGNEGYIQRSIFRMYVFCMVFRVATFSGGTVAEWKYRKN